MNINDAHCFLCGNKEVVEDDFCEGCRQYICQDCDQEHGLMGSHEPEDHLETPDSPADYDESEGGQDGNEVQAEGKG